MRHVTRRVTPPAPHSATWTHRRRRVLTWGLTGMGQAGKHAGSHRRRSSRLADRRGGATTWVEEVERRLMAVATLINPRTVRRTRRADPRALVGILLTLAALAGSVAFWVNSSDER